jgi:quercetin dioxygenase-like cupin family protein
MTADGVTRLAIPAAGGDRVLSLGQRLAIESVGVNVFTFHPGEGSRIHRHRRQEEIYLVLRGVLTVRLEGEELQLRDLEVVRVPPSVRRQLSNRGEETCVFVAVGAYGRHVGGDAEAFRSWDDATPRSPSDVPLPGARRGAT